MSDTFTPAECDDEDYVSQVTAGVYLSGLLDRFPANVSAVMCLCLHSEILFAQKTGHYCNPFDCWIQDFAWRPIDDNPGNIPSVLWLHESVNLIESWRKQGRTVLVHCALGVSRSVTVVAAYLMKKYDWSADDAMRFIRVARPPVRPNDGLLDLLAEYERKLAAGSTFPPSVVVHKVRCSYLG